MVADLHAQEDVVAIQYVGAGEVVYPLEPLGLQHPDHGAPDALQLQIGKEHCMKHISVMPAAKPFPLGAL